MDRRTFLASVASGLLAAPLAAEAQPTRKVPRIGFVSSNVRTVMHEDFVQALRERGYVVGQSIIVESRFADGHIDRVSALVGEVLNAGVDVLMAATPYVIRAARQATSSVPVVGVDLETDPIAAGWIKTLARPGGNLTGFFLDMPELSSKQVQFLAEAVARLQRVAVLWDVDLARAQFQATEHAAQAARLRLQSLGFHPPGEFAALFNEARARQAQALIILSSPSVFPLLLRLADLAHQYRLPAMSMFPEFAADGGLIGYGPDLADLFRRAAGYVDRILKGEKPGDLPIQRPAIFDLVINLKTAKTLGLAIPQSLLLRADEVIQ